MGTTAVDSSAVVGSRLGRDPLLAIDALSKTFPGQVALDEVSLRLMPGEVHAVVGQNGSGKSTLAKILAGYHVPDPGARAQLLGHDATLPFDDAAARRFHFVHQDLGLVDTLDVLDNFGLVLGYDTRLGTIDWRAAAAEVREALCPFGLERIDLSAPVGRLPAWQRAVIAIARGLSGWEIDQGVLVLDETTAALPHTEAAVLFEAIRGIASRQAAVLYITHRLDEVFEVADAVSVLRNGRLIGTHAVQSITKSFLIREMVGALPTVPVRDRHGTDQVRLRLEDVYADGIEDVSASVKSGEIVGVAGLVGSGREVLADVIYGVRPLDAGRVEINGKLLVTPTPRRVQRAGLALVPSDRKTRGLFPSLAMATNMTLSHHRQLWRRGRIDTGAERTDVHHWIDALGIQPPDPDRLVGVLSGGNQQKVMLAPPLRRQPSVLLLDEPTQGVDIGAKRAIYNLIEQIASAGTAVLLCTAEPEDLPELCDRVVVMRHGRVGAVLAGAELNIQLILEEACR